MANQEKGSIDNFLDEVLAMSGMTNSKQPSQGSNVPVPTPRPEPDADEAGGPSDGDMDNVPVPTPRPDPNAETDATSPEADEIVKEAEAIGAPKGIIAAAVIGTIGLAAGTKYLLSKYGADAQPLIEEGKQRMQVLNEETRQLQQSAGVDTQAQDTVEGRTRDEVMPRVQGDAEEVVAPSAIEAADKAQSPVNDNIDQMLMDEIEGRSPQTRNNGGGNVDEQAAAEMEGRTPSAQQTQAAPDARAKIEAIIAENKNSPDAAVRAIREAGLPIHEYPELMQNLVRRANGMRSMKGGRVIKR
jgi:hypothetical protein